MKKIYKKPLVKVCFVQESDSLLQSISTVITTEAEAEDAEVNESGVQRGTGEWEF